MKFKLFILLFILFFNHQVVAQNSYDLLTVNIDSVVVESQSKSNKNPELNIATKTSSISKQILSQAMVKSLADVLTENSAIYIRSNGDGSASTSSFRGTNSSHTAVTWNGVKINPVMSTGFDYSLFPAFFIDGATLSHGSSDLSGGSGALGGNVSLSNKITNETPRLNFFSEFGSFETLSSGLSVRYGNSDKTIARTRLYYKQSEGNFKYLNKVYGKDQFYEYREEADYKIGGAMQEINTKLRRGSLSTSLLAIISDRSLPQPVVSTAVCEETQTTGSVKFASTYLLPTKNGSFQSTIGYLFDKFSYERVFKEYNTGNSDEKNNSHTFTAKLSNINRITPRFSLSETVIFSQDLVISDNYNENITRSVISTIVKGEFKASNKLYLDAIAMGEVNYKKIAPTANIGVSYLISNNWKAKYTAAYNYRFPSLNDLYWIPGGNPDLKEEKGISTDFTLSYNSKFSENIYFKGEASYYLMNIKDWIQWMPMNGSYIWSPQNLLRVLSHGAEVSAEINYLISNDLRAKIAGSYTYSSSTSREKAFENDASYKKQLQYIPIHKSNLRLGVDYKKSFLTWQMFQVGERFTTSDNQLSTNGYLINDLEVGYNFEIGKKEVKLPVRFKINNIFNTYWESTQYYPMPLRYFSINIGISL